MEDPRITVARVRAETRRIVRATKLQAATIAYHFPQYTLIEAAELSVGDARLLLSVIEMERAINARQALNAAAAAGDKKAFEKYAGALDSLIKRYQEDL